MKRNLLFLGIIFIMVLLALVVILTREFSAPRDSWYGRGVINKEQKEKRIHELQEAGYNYRDALYKWDLEEGEERVRELEDKEYHKFGNEEEAP